MDSVRSTECNSNFNTCCYREERFATAVHKLYSSHGEYAGGCCCSTLFDCVRQSRRRAAGSSPPPLPRPARTTCRASRTSCYCSLTAAAAAAAAALNASCQSSPAQQPILPPDVVQHLYPSHEVINATVNCCSSLHYVAVCGQHEVYCSSI